MPFQLCGRRSRPPGIKASLCLHYSGGIRWIVGPDVGRQSTATRCSREAAPGAAEARVVDRCICTRNPRHRYFRSGSTNRALASTVTCCELASTLILRTQLSDLPTSCPSDKKRVSR
jgi:hypothetical protein